MITRKLVGVSRSDSGVGPAGVGGSLEAWIPCRREGRQTLLHLLSSLIID